MIAEKRINCSFLFLSTVWDVEPVVTKQTS